MTPDLILVKEDAQLVVLNAEGPQGAAGPPGPGVAGNNDIGVIYLKNNTIPTPIGAINQRAVVSGSMQTGELFNFAKDATTNSLKYLGDGGKFHIVATFNFSDGNQHTCGFYIGHNTNDSTPLSADADRISESEIYINSSTAANQPVGGAIQTVAELDTNDRIFFIVQNKEAAQDITVEFLKFIAVPLTSEKGAQGAPGSGIASGGTTNNLLVRTASGTAWTANPSVDSVQLDVTASGVTAPGQLRWNAVEGTVDIGLLNGTVNQVGQEVQMLCKNSAASLTIANGAGVMFTGSDPTTLRLEVQPMDASGDLPGYVFFGIATQTIPPSGEGYITTFGKVRNIDTSAYPEDSILWCDPVNPGQFVTTEPEAPNLKIAAAAVIKSHPVSGVVMVRADTGQNLADCHDVEVATAQDADYLGWSEDMQHWMPFPVKNDAPKSITISEPLAGDSFTLFRTTKSTTLNSVVGLVVGSSSPSLSYQLRYASDRTASGTAATPVTFINNTTSGAPATIQNMPVPSGNYVWLNITAVSGTTSEFNLSVGF